MPERARRRCRRCCAPPRPPSPCRPRRGRAPPDGCCSRRSPPARTPCPAPAARRRRRRGRARSTPARSSRTARRPSACSRGWARRAAAAARPGGRRLGARGRRARRGAPAPHRSRGPRDRRSGSRRPAAGPESPPRPARGARTRKMPSSVTWPIGVALELPLGADRLDLGHPVRARPPPASAPAIRESRISYGVIPGSRVGHQAGVDLHADAAARRHLGAGAGEAGGAHVLDGDDEPGGDQLEAGLEQQLLGERIAHLHLGPPGLALLAQLLRGEARAVDAVASGARADAEQHVAHALRPPRGSGPPPGAARRTSR